MIRQAVLILAVLLVHSLEVVSVELGSPKILIARPEPPKETENINDPSLNSEKLLKIMNEIVSPSHPEMYGRWQKYVRSQNLDPDNEDRTLIRLQRKYLDSIKDWGEHVSDCDSTRSSGRWVRRLRRKFGDDEIRLHKKEIAKIITSLYLQRKNECMQAKEDSALRAEREVYAFTLERTRLLIDFISQNSEMQISALNKYRMLNSLKNKQNMHTLGDRSIDLNSLRLETKLQNLPPIYVDFLAHEQSFKKPFDLHKNLSLLSSEYGDEPTTTNNKKPLPVEKTDKTPEMKPENNPVKKSLDLSLPKSS